MYQFIYIILNYNTYQKTIELVNELLAGPMEDRLILVVDNASPNESFAQLSTVFAHKQGVEIIASPENGGFAKGNNFGLKYVAKYNPTYVCVINNDIHIDVYLVDRLAIWYKSLPNAGLIAPVQWLPNGKPALFSDLNRQTWWVDFKNYVFPSRHHFHKYIENTNYPGAHAIYIVPGAFLFASYEHWKAVDFFYEGTFLYCEERFLAERMYQQGLKNYIILNEHYIHEHGVTINSVANARKQMSMIYQGRTLYAKEVRHDNQLQLFLLRIGYGIMVMRYLLRSQFKKAIR